MPRNLLILAMLLFLGNNAQIFLTSFHNPLECTINSSDFWKVCETHFLLVDFLTILVLQTEQHKLELNYFTEALLKVMSGYEFPVALKIEEHVLSDPNKNQTRPFSDEAKIDDLGGRNIQPVEYEKLAEIKKLSSDSLKGYFIIVWDVATLHQFLDDDYQIVIPEARATYSLHFVFTSSEPCQGIKYQLSDILQRFWIGYHVVNVIAQTPCSCDNQQVFIHRPFVRTKSSWGVTNVYTLQEITNNYRLITNPLDNFNRVPLRIAMFPRVPALLQDLPKLLKNNPIYQNLSWSKGFAGVDAMILGTLAESLNFDVVVVGNRKKNFGYAFPNGTTTGVLGDVSERRAVYGANSRLITDQDLQQIEFTTPNYADAICMVVPKAAKVPIWASIFKSFTITTWLLIISTCVICTMFWHCIRSSNTASWTMFAVLAGTPTQIVPNNGQSFFLVSCMIFNIVILGVIQGSLFTNFTTTTHYADINTLQELDESELPIAMSLWQFLQVDSDLIRRIQNKSILQTDMTLDLVAYQRNLITCDSKSYLEFQMRTKYIDNDGLPLLHIVNECLTTCLVANIVPKGSVLLSVFNNVITKAMESGLIVKWNNDIIDSLTAEKMISLSRNRTSVRAFSLYDVQTAFYVVILGHSLSILLFLCEYLHK
jgi:hypothetical protein